ncbi:pilus assembly protein [Rhizobium sp. CG5]|uniref:TadE/TadG family type IV pilus assembly protein n=1 Tax=Rhizobium sp. CG5 TaxID=2726076 RepID=UPI0025504587|nr:TadE/TadG family type IV pilus assembly protein [Rhizobium sp. CG5]MCM2474910.1 pilus assembly protein [Rhizobium sp. CG5]
MPENISQTKHKSIVPLLQERTGNFGIMTAILLPVLLTAAGGAVDMSRAFNEKAHLQMLIDAAVLAAAQETDPQKQFEVAKQFVASAVPEDTEFTDILGIDTQSDGSIKATFDGSIDTPFLGLIGIDTYDITVTATAIGGEDEPVAAACLYVLGSKGQDVLINSGANVYSKDCSAQVHSTANPALIMNSGSKIELAKVCLKGTKYIKNGGTLSNLVTNCAAEADPYAGTLPEPSVPSQCTTSGWKDGQKISLKPGLHCETGFNGSPTITFEPGLHIIKGRMIINSNATVIAEGVTFYFPDVYSEIRINGGVKFTGTGPTSGTYKGILMFENTSDSSNAANKQQYIFNGSLGEVLEGIIHLPNRDVTYNSTTNQISRISLVVNTMIMNSANWLIEPYTGKSSSTGTSTAVRLVN